MTAPVARPYFPNLWAAAGRLSPEAIEVGRAWYALAMESEILPRSETEWMPPERMAWAAAALTAGMSWAATLSTLDGLLAARRRGARDFPRRGLQAAFGFRGCARAWLLITNPRPDPEAVVTGPKVAAFGRALLGDGQAVPVDRHVIRAATGRAVDQLGPAPTRAIATALRAVAGLRGLQPAQLQAAIWTGAHG